MKKNQSPAWVVYAKEMTAEGGLVKTKVKVFSENDHNKALAYLAEISEINDYVVKKRFEKIDESFCSLDSEDKD